VPPQRFGPWTNRRRGDCLGARPRTQPMHCTRVRAEGPSIGMYPRAGGPANTVSRLGGAFTAVLSKGVGRPCSL